MNGVAEKLNTSLKSALLELVIQYEENGQYQHVLNHFEIKLKKILPFEKIDLFIYHAGYEKFTNLITYEQILSENEISFTVDEASLKLKNSTWKEETFKHYQLAFEYSQVGNDFNLMVHYNDNFEFFVHFQNGYDNFEDLAQEMPTIAHILGVFSHKHNLSIERRTAMQLYNVTSKLHSSIDLNDVLNEITKTLGEVYPTFTHALYLTYDYDYDVNLPIFGFDKICTSKSANDSFITGNLSYELNAEKNEYRLFAPLRGQQGVYGVLVVSIPRSVALSDSDTRFIGILGQTAGKSIENAQLYTQSQKLIRNLQLINDTSHRLNTDLRIIEVVSFVKKQIKKSTLAQKIGFMIIKPGGAFEVLAGSSSIFYEDESKEIIKAIIKLIHNPNEPLLIRDLSDELSREVDYRSAMLIPMQLANGQEGLAIVLHEKPFIFTFDAFKLLQSLIYHCSLALSNSMLKNELEQLVITDYLTQLYSRSYLDLKIQKSLTKDQNGAFVLIDIDNFKKINDTYGHQTGDDLLVQVSQIVKGCIRDRDIASRWGGEEIAIYLPNASLQTGSVVAQRISEQVSNESTPGITISCGISYWGGDHLISPKQLFKNADNALYEAKNSGKNKVVISDENHMSQ